MVERKTVSGRVFDIANVLILGVVALACLYPVWHVVMGSFSEANKLGVHSGVLLWPQGYSLLGYEIVFKNRFIWLGYLNTIYLIVVGTVARMFMTSLGAYVLSRKDFMLRKYILKMIIVTMYFGGGMIPSYLLIRNLGLYNTYAALILPSLIATWNMFVLRSAFQAVPASLDESARIDGANDLTILLRIIFPVTKATLAVIALYYVVSAWNSWFTATIYLQERSKYRLSHTTAPGSLFYHDQTTCLANRSSHSCQIKGLNLPQLDHVCHYAFASQPFCRGQYIVNCGSIGDNRNSRLLADLI